MEWIESPTAVRLFLAGNRQLWGYPVRFFQCSSSGTNLNGPCLKPFKYRMLPPKSSHTWETTRFGCVSKKRRSEGLDNIWCAEFFYCIVFWGTIIDQLKLPLNFSNPIGTCRNPAENNYADSQGNVSKLHYPPLKIQGLLVAVCRLTSFPRHSRRLAGQCTARRFTRQSAKRSTLRQCPLPCPGNPASR